VKQRETVYLTWEKPSVVTEWEWQNEGVPQTKNLYRLWIKWSILLGVPALCTIYFLAPERLLPSTLVVAALAVAQPAVLGYQMRLKQRHGYGYRLTDKGLHWRTADNGGRYSWSDLESFRIYAHSDVAGVRVLELQVKRYKSPRRWFFDPQQIEERDITRLLSEHGVSVERV
jgi:hypothetical protein